MDGVGTRRNSMARYCVDPNIRVAVAFDASSSTADDIDRPCRFTPSFHRQRRRDMVEMYAHCYSEVALEPPPQPALDTVTSLSCGAAAVSLRPEASVNVPVEGSRPRLSLVINVTHGNYYSGLSSESNMADSLE